MQKTLLGIYVIFISSLAIYAQAPRIETLKLFKNIKDVEVNHIFQDDKGYMWIGTNSGLVHYDGFDFIPFEVDLFLSESKVTASISDSLGRIWFGHENGVITVKDGDSFKLFEPEEGLGSREISSFFIDKNEVLWFSTLGEGVYCYKGKNRKRLYNISSDEGLLDNYVYSIIQDKSGLYYFGTDKGISIYDGDKKEFIEKISMSNGLPDNIVKQLTIVDNVLWIAMEDAGVCSYNISTKNFENLTEWDFGSINNFSVINENEIWISTKRKGIVKWQINGQNNSFSMYNKENGLVDNRTKTMLCDREGNLWIGTKKGLSIRRNNFVEFFNKESGFSITQIFSITKDENGNYWIASQEGLFIVSQNHKGKLSLEQILTDAKYEFATFISVYTDAQGYIWAGTYGMGVFRINPATKKINRYTADEGLCNNNIIHITGDRNKVWLSSLGGGVSIFNIETKGFNTISMEQGLPSNYVYHTYIDDKDTSWIGTDGGGVAKIINNKVVPVHHPLLDSIGKVVYSIVGNNNGVIWFNVADHGVIRFEDDSCLHITEMNNLVSNSIQGMILNDNNELVLVSSLGIGLLNCSSLDEQNIGEEDGVAHLNPNLNAIYKDSSGNVFIGHGSGIVKLLSHSHDSIILPRLYITKIKLLDQEISKEKNVFKHKENYLTFDYRGLWYSSSQDILYRFKLEGYDMGWREPTTSRSFTYSSLPPGEYAFQVEMKLPTGDWYSLKTASYVFEIKPPFWKTIVFMVSMFILITLLIYSYIVWRERKLKQDKELLEQEVLKRTAEIREQKDEIEAQRDEIEAQRNHVMKQHAKIEHQNNEITSSITYASRIQRAVLPPKENFDELLKQYFIFFKPRDIVSGDFYYLNRVHNKVIVAAADCTGHGVPGAFMSMLGISSLNQIVSHLQKDYNAATILNQLREHIKSSLRQTGENDKAKDGMDISLSVIDFDKKVVHFAGAFNPLLLVRNNETREYKGDKMPIGVHIVEKESFTNHEIEIQTDDMIYMYSDGFQDQFGGEKLRKFLPKNLRNLLLENSTKDLSYQEQKLDEAFNAWKGIENQIDDVIVLGVRI